MKLKIQIIWLCAIYLLGNQCLRADWLVKTFRDGSSATTLADADKLIATTTPIATGTIPYTDLLGYSTGEGTGHFSLNYPVAGLPQNQPTDDYAIEVTGTLSVPVTGYYTFGLNTDDGARLVIDGTTVITDDAIHPPRDSAYVPITLTVGSHSVQWIWFNHGGGATAEVFWAGGIYSGFNSSFVLLGNSTTTTQPIPQNGVLVAYWPFNGNANDASGNGNNSVVNGAQLTTDRFGNPNSAFNFNGYLECANFSGAASGNPITVSAWIFKTSTNPNYHETILATEEFRFQTRQQGQLNCGVVGSSWFEASPVLPMQLNTWHHVVVVLNGTTIQLYQDGALILQAINSAAPVQIRNCRIGCDGLSGIGGTDYFNGKIDDVRIYNRALSDLEVEALYSQGDYFQTAILQNPCYQMTVPPLPPKQPGKNNLVVVTHGWLPISPDVAWITNECNSISNQLVSRGSNDWQVVPYAWASQAGLPPWYSFTGNNIIGDIGSLQFANLAEPALENAENIGTQIGRQIASQGWSHVHLIGHSAGAGLIQKAAEAIRANAPGIAIHTTFLDPFFGKDYHGFSKYGTAADWADSYFDNDVTGSYTEGNLPHAFNVNVTWTEPSPTIIPAYDSVGFPAGCYAQSPLLPFLAHVYPHDFYEETVLGTQNSCAASLGFPLSKEGGGWNNHSGYSVGNTAIVPCQTCASLIMPNVSPLRTDGGLNFPSLPYDISPSGAALLDLSAFTLSSSSPPIPHAHKTPSGGSGVHPLDAGGSSTNSTGTPAWLAVGLTITNAVNFIQFDAAFTSTNTAEGLLTVYWDTNQIGTVDERVVSPGLATHRFFLPETVTNNVYVLGFRLDAFNDTSPSITITNVATGFAGVTQPLTLGITLTNQTPILQLTGASNYNYLVESSTNLVDWTPMALLVNSNGTVLFPVPAATNANAQFYRAVMP